MSDDREGAAATGEVRSRAERKERTRQALLDATLVLVADRSFSSVSLREIARGAGVVPTAFYRHFSSMDDLGVTLVEQSMRVLRQMLRDARRDPGPKNATTSLSILVKHVRSHEDQFRFLTRERYGGSAEVRRAIDTELRLFTHELTIDLARMPGLEAWEIEDLETAAHLIVTTMLTTVADLLDAQGDRGQDAIRSRAEKQLRLLVLGMSEWRPRT